MTSLRLGLTLVASAIFWASSAAWAASSPRTVTNLDFDWRFALGDFPAASAETFDDSAWRMLDVPHDWSIEGEYKEDNPGGANTGYLPTGIGWYRKSFDVTPEMLKQSETLFFDGVFMDATVWVNGRQLGNHPYGYMSFFYELAGHLHEGRNTIAVRVDNLLQPAARWYTGSGIYAHVRLVSTSSLHLTPWSTFVRSTKIDAVSATIAVSTAIDTPAALPKTTASRLQITVLDSANQAVASQAIDLKTQAVPVDANPAELTIAHPALWSPDSPTLYTLRMELFDGTTLVDSEETPFGLRSVRFDPAQGMFLNGRPIKLKGVADHFSQGPMGAAIPDAMLVRRLTLLKQMGVNAIRTAHNPCPPLFYDLCDRMGFLVMDEIYDGWKEKAQEDYGGRFYQARWRDDVKDWVCRDRNHPSVFLWSLGNETGAKDVNHMSEWVHRFDPTRLTTGGMMTDGVGVAGWNGPGEVSGVLEKWHAGHPTVPLVLTEEPHTLQTRGYYRVRTWWRDWKHWIDFPSYGIDEIFFDGNPWYNSSYDNAMVRITSRGCWQRTAETPWIIGEFRWTANDYLGEAALKGGRWPARAGNYGIIDLAGIPKDIYYFYQSAWTTQPMVHLLPSWTQRGMDGITIPVVAYSNQKEVELFLNGKSLGRHKPEALGDFLWQVPYAPGELKAVAYGADGQAAATTSFVTAGPPTGIRLETDNSALKPDRTDDAVMTFTIVDKNGVMVPWSQDRVDFQVTGPVRLLGYENGDPVDVTAHQVSHRNAFYGMGRGFFQATADDGPIEVTAASVLGDPYLGLGSPKNRRQVSIAVSRISLRGELPAEQMEIHYTLDGSEPDEHAPLYSGAFFVDNDTTVKAVVLRDGRPFLHISKSFLKLEPPLVTDPRWSTNSQQDPAKRNIWP